MFRLLPFVLGSVALVVGCGSSHGRGDEDAGPVSGDGGLRDTGLRDASFPDAMPPPDDAGPAECRVEASAPPPYPTVFRFLNSTDRDLYLGEDCRLRFNVSSCASGFEPVPLNADCTAACSEPDMGCIACGACPTTSVAVPPGESYEVEWSGQTYAFDTTASGCPCYHPMPAQPGWYRVTVGVYESADEAEVWGMPSHTVELPFQLPAAGGTVTIPLSPP